MSRYHLPPTTPVVQEGTALGRTNITVNDPELWKWAKKRAVDLELKGVSEYLFLLIEEDRANDVLDAEAILKEEST